MKKHILSVLALGACLSAGAQTMNVVVGEVTYQIPAAKAGEMIYSDATSLTVLDKTFSIADISDIYIDGAEVTENAVSVNWNGDKASVFVPYNIMSQLAIEAEGSDVSIIQSADVAEEITYTLSGSSTDGSLYMDGELKTTFVMNGLNLTNPTGAAINIRDGKRIAIILNEGTENYLADGANGSHKAAFMVNGHSEFNGAGTLTIVGNTKHAFWGDEYVELKKKLGTINITKAVGDGMNINQYFLQKGGTLNITGVGDDGIQVSKTDDDTDENNGEVMLEGGTTYIKVTGTAAKGINAESNITASAESTANITVETTGGGEWDSDKQKTKASACMKSDANINIAGGTFKFTSTGSGGKGINCDGELTIDGGTFNISTTGSRYTYGSTGGGGGWPGGGNSGNSDKRSSAKGMKVDGNVTINGGTIVVSATGGEGSECIESKKIMTINGGTIEANGYDDCLNSASHMYVKGGQIYANATNNDGLDANGNMYIQGGTHIVYGGSSPECGIDANEENGYHVVITGGTLVGIGGGTSYPTSSGTTQPTIVYKGTIIGNSYYSLTKDDGTPILAFKSLKGSSSGGSSYVAAGPGGPGGGNGNFTVLITSPELAKGSKYILYSGSTVSGDDFHGLYMEPTVSSTGTSIYVVDGLSLPYSSNSNSGGWW